MRVVELSGGVGGARLGRGLAAADGVELTVVVNVGDDLPTHGLHVAPDIDTVIYTLAGVEGEHGWGRAGDTFVTNTELARFGVDNRFRLGDLDLALKIYRTARLAAGDTLSAITDSVRSDFGIRASILPATDDILRTMVTISSGQTLTFQAYFVEREHRDHVLRLEFNGSEEAKPGPGVMESIEAADVVVVGPSNPPLSIWPILAVPGIEEAIRNHPRVVAVSPLIGGVAVKGPAATVMADLGLGSGTGAVIAAYRGLIDTLVVNDGDRQDQGIDGANVVEMDTLIPDLPAAARLARAILDL
jgi:LPPG:FO 2-phospho-L-lactate transferase